MDEFIILIPALNPPKEILTSYIKDLKDYGFTRILLVDDGSKQAYNEYFQNLKNEGLDVFRHYKNLGKGRALKNAFNYILNEYENFTYVITVDSDGQHKAKDVYNIASTAKIDSANIMFLGSRNFNEDNVPFKSSFGNKATSFLYKLMFSQKINDTQTGLRAIPNDFLKDFLDIPGERFEFEINMLINSTKNNKKLIEIPMQTIYFDNNSETHFNPIVDSFKIYKIMLGTFFKFILASLSSFIVDIGIFTILTKVFNDLIFSSSRIIWLSTIIARIISGIFNFNINDKLVFSDQAGFKSKDKAIKYFTLWSIQMFMSAFFVDFIIKKVSYNASFIKLLVDTIIFLVSFNIQNKYIFQGEK